MQLTHYTDFSLRVLIYLSLQEDRGLVTASDIAQHFDIARNHLLKVSNRLGQLGHVEAVRGKGGGLRLARRPNEIVIGQVVRDMEANMEVIDCSKPLCPLLPACQLKGIFNQAMDAFLQVLDDYTLADLIGQPQQIRDLLHMAAPRA